MINANNHVFLISEIKFSNTNDIVKNICKKFLSDSEDKELFYKKIDNNNYYDYIEFNLYLDEIKVDQIREMKKKFYSISLESSGYKFYVIRNIELMTDKIANSLLKFIEEPPSKTIAIFTTRNASKVLPTIYSRCEEIKSQSSLNEVELYLNQNKIESLRGFYFNSFYSIEEIKIFDNSKNKEVIIDIYQNLKKNIDDESKLIKHFEKFKKLSNKEILVLLNSFLINLNLESKQKMLELSNNLKYNLSKALIFNEILNII